MKIMWLTYLAQNISTFLCSSPVFMAPEVVLTGQGLSPVFGPSGPKVCIIYCQWQHLLMWYCFEVLIWGHTLKEKRWFAMFCSYLFFTLSSYMLRFHISPMTLKSNQYLISSYNFTLNHTLKDYKNKGNDNQLKLLVFVKQILLVSPIVNV